VQNIFKNALLSKFNQVSKYVAATPVERGLVPVAGQFPKIPALAVPFTFNRPMALASLIGVFTHKFEEDNKNEDFEALKDEKPSFLRSTSTAIVGAGSSDMSEFSEHRSDRVRRPSLVRAMSSVTSQKGAIEFERAKFTEQLAVSLAPATQAADSMTEEEVRAEHKFRSLQVIFLGAIETMSEKSILAQFMECRPLIKIGAFDVNRSIKDSTKSTFLHTAAWFTKKNLIKFLLSSGANPNAINTSGNTPLHLLCEKANEPGVLEMIQIFLEFGGNLNLPDKNGKTPMDKAKAKGVDLINMPQGDESDLRHQREKKQQRSASSDTSQRVESVRATIVRLLADVQAVPQNEAAIIGQLEENRALAGVASLLQDKSWGPDGSTLLHVAAHRGLAKLVKALLGSQADPNVQDNAGNNALHVACAQCQANPGTGRDVIKLLVDAGANVQALTFLRNQRPIDRMGDTDPNKVWAAALFKLGGAAAAQARSASVKPGQIATPARKSSALEQQRPSLASSLAAPMSPSSPTPQPPPPQFVFKGPVKGDIVVKLQARHEFDDIGELFSVLAEDGLPTISREKLLALHQSMHFCDCAPALVEDVMSYFGAIDQKALGPALAMFLFLCERYNHMHWDYKSASVGDTGILEPHLMEAVWHGNRISQFQPSFEESLHKGKRVLSMDELYKGLIADVPVDPTEFFR
jgi:hypothetical protein